MGYGSESICDTCGARNEYATITVSLPLPADRFTRYYCNMCSVTVEIPESVESRFLLAISDSQTDQYGNPSWYRSELAQILKTHGRADRMYALVPVPQLTIDCPVHRTPLQLWHDYPSARLMKCRECNAFSVLVDGASWISGSMITDW